MPSGRPLTRVLAAVRRELSRGRNRFGLPRVRLVHHPRYGVPEQHLVDGHRGARVASYLAGRRWIRDVDVAVPPPLPALDLVRVHDPGYLASLDRPDELERLFAGASASAAARILDAQRWATAGTVHAATVAVRYPWMRSPVVNLGGGFHHARRARASGFCAFNDVAIALEKLRAHGFAGRVLIVDLDAHHGDGTRSFFAEDARVFTYSLHGQSLDDSPAVANLDVALGPAVGDVTYARALADTLPEAFDRARPDLVFYVAGVDVAAGDLIGGFRLSAGAISARDAAVLARASGLPTVMVLAGGYGPDAWRHTARTLEALLSGEDRPIPSSDERALAKFRAIRRSIAAESLRGDHVAPDAFSITDADVYGDLVAKVPDERLLGFYTTYGLEVSFERYGLADHLRSRGYGDFIVAADANKRGAGHGLRVYADATRSQVLIELLLTELPLEGWGRMLSIEWLLLQDPRRRVSPEAPLLPGQTHPGLGCLRIVVGMLVMACERLGFDGITVVPSHYHVAAQARRVMAFMDPHEEALFLALGNATQGMPLFAASRLIADGGVIDVETGAPVRYTPSRMVLPVSAEARTRLESPAHARAVEDAARSLSLQLRRDPDVQGHSH